MEADLKHNSVPLLEQKKHQLQAIRNRRLEGMMVKSRVEWFRDGKRASRYFCNLEKRNYTSSSMSFIETRDGKTVFSQKEILDETKAFYENLYSQKETVDVDLGTLLSNAPSLTHEEREITEGQITYTETLAAVQAMKNNKSRGPDGYTPEFYTNIFRDIGNFLVRSINYGCQNGEMSVTPKQGIITCIRKEGNPDTY